jgi:signal transduction histidine kinase
MKFNWARKLGNALFLGIFAFALMSAAGNGTGADTLLDAGNEAYNQGKIDLALERYFKYLNACREEGNRSGEGEALRKIGDTFRANGDHWRCLEYLEKAEAIAKELDDERLLARVFNRIAADYFEMNDNDMAFKYADSSLVLTRKLGYLEFQANNLNILGAIARNQEDFPKAIQYLEESIELQRRLGDTLDVPNVMNNIANTWFISGQYDKSIKVARQSLVMAHRSQSLPYQQYAIYILKESFKARHQYDSALVYHEQYKFLTDSLSKRERTQAMTDLETQFEMKERDRQLEALRKEQEIQESSRSKLLTLAIVLAVALACMAITLVMLLISRRQRTLAHKLLQREMQKVELQNAEIEAQRRSLSENNQIRDRLFSVIAHDLRSPLNSLQGIMHLMKAGALNEQELRALLRGLNDRIDSTSMLVDNLLNWAKSQLQGFQVMPVQVDLGEVIEQQVKLVQPLADSKEIDIYNKVLLGTMVHADISMTEVMVRNLLSNAIKFTPRKGSVTLQVEGLPDHLCLHVIDTGIGIPEEVRGKLFTGSHFSTVGTAREGGSGLGLMLVKEFVEKNGGSLNIHSSPGKGSDFSICLPRG